MNCKPGDIAIVYRTFAPGMGEAVPPELRDRIVQVDNVYLVHGLPCWNLVEPARFKASADYKYEMEDGTTTHISEGDIVSLYTLPDACLRPIRDPGDHAIDEMLAMTLGVAS